MNLIDLELTIRQQAQRIAELEAHVAHLESGEALVAERAALASLNARFAKLAAERDQAVAEAKITSARVTMQFAKLVADLEMTTRQQAAHIARLEAASLPADPITGTVRNPSAHPAPDPGRSASGTPA